MLNGLGDKHASYSVVLIKDEFQSTNNEANGIEVNGTKLFGDSLIQESICTFSRFSAMLRFIDDF